MIQPSKELVSQGIEITQRKDGKVLKNITLIQ